MKLSSYCSQPVCFGWWLSVTSSPYFNSVLACNIYSSGNDTAMLMIKKNLPSQLLCFRSWQSSAASRKLMPWPYCDWFAAGSSTKLCSRASEACLKAIMKQQATASCVPAHQENDGCWNHFFSTIQQPHLKEGLCQVLVTSDVRSWSSVLRSRGYFLWPVQECSLNQKTCFWVAGKRLCRTVPGTLL